MHTRYRYSRMLASLIFAGSVLALTLPANTYGDPPPWAPAHGWRKKNDPYYTGYTGKKWDKHYSRKHWSKGKHHAHKGKKWKKHH